MSAKMWITLGVLIAIVTATTLQFEAEESAEQGSDATRIRLPMVDAEQVQSLEITTPNNGSVTLTRTATGFQVTAPVAGEADQGAIDKALKKLSELRASGVAATKTAHHAKLGVTADKGVHVIAKDSHASVLADLWLGAYRSSYTMVREDSSTRVARVYGSLSDAFDKPLKDWRDRRVVSEAPEDLVKINLENSAGALVFERVGGSFKPAAGQAPIPNFDPAMVEAFASSLSRLAALDFADAGVAPEDAGTAAGAQAQVTLTYQTPRPADAPPATTPGDAPPAEPRTITLTLGQKVGENFYLQRTGNPNVFQVSSYIGARLTAGPEQFIKLEPPQETAGVQTPSGLPAVPSGAH